MATRYKLLNVNSDGDVVMTHLGARSFTKKVAETMAADLRDRGYTILVEPDRASTETRGRPRLTKHDVGRWVSLKDPSGRVQWGGVYKVVSVGRVNIRASQDVRFSPTGPWYHQTHTVPMSHVQRVVPLDEIAFREGDAPPR